MAWVSLDGSEQGRQEEEIGETADDLRIGQAARSQGPRHSEGHMPQGNGQPCRIQIVFRGSPGS